MNPFMDFRSRTRSGRALGWRRHVPFGALVGMLVGTVGLLHACDRGPAAPRPADPENGDPFVMDVMTRTADAVERAPRNPVGWATLGEIHHAHLAYGPALEAYDVSVGLDSSNPRVLYARALCRKELGDDAGGLEDLRAAMELDRATPHLRWRAALWAIESGDLDTAERWATDAFKLSRGDRDSRRVLARVNLQAGRPTEAIELLVPIVRKRPNDREVWAILAQAHRSAGDLEEAVRTSALAGAPRPMYTDDWNNAIATRRTDRAWWMRRAQRAANGGDPANGRVILDSVLAKWYPGDRETEFTRGVILVAEGDLDEASAVFGSLVEAHPDWAAARSRLAAVEMQQAGRLAEGSPDRVALVSDAIGHLSRACEIEPEQAGSVQLLVSALAQSAELERAIELQQGLVRMETWQLGHRIALAGLQRTLGDPTAAIETIEEARTVFGSIPRLDVESARCLLELGRVDEASSLVDRAEANAGRELPGVGELRRRLEAEARP